MSEEGSSHIRAIQSSRTAAAATNCIRCLHTQSYSSAPAVAHSRADVPLILSGSSDCIRGGGDWLFLADMHFDHKRLDRLRSTCEWILSECATKQPSHIFLLGDTLHTRNEVHVEASSAVATFLRNLLALKYKDKPQPHVHVLVGNQSVNI